MEKNKNNYCIIMAGGIGSRFWPLSRPEKPKQFIDALGIGKTFIQMTYERFSEFIVDENFLVVTGEIYRDLVLEQLPMLKPEQVLTEPCRRNTAPCVAYATYKIYKQNKDAVAVVTPSDQYIGNQDVFAKQMQMILDYAAKSESLVTIGINPTFPATGYGYIQMENVNEEICKVSAFKEKPDLETAKKFLTAGNYAWNSGMFIWSIKSIKAALEKHVPNIAASFAGVSRVYGTPEELETVNKVYEQSENISIDYGVMEKADNVYVCRSSFSWSDIGSWGSLYDQLPKDDSLNAVSGNDGKYVHSDGCLVKELNAGKRVVVDGLTDYIVVDDKDVLMICPRKDEVRIKKLIEASSK
jgi:mannose-1-phosphate guanylyltransferase